MLTCASRFISLFVYILPLPLLGWVGFQVGSTGVSGHDAITSHVKDMPLPVERRTVPITPGIMAPSVVPVRPSADTATDVPRAIVQPDPILGRYYGPMLTDYLVRQDWQRSVHLFFAHPLTLEQEAQITEIYNYVLNRFKYVRKTKFLSEQDRKTCMLVAESIVRAASGLGLDYRMVAAIAEIESTYNQESVSYKMAIGIMQIHYPTWGGKLGLLPHELKNIPANVYLGCWILRRYLEDTGWDVPAALGKYYGMRSAEYLRRVNTSLLRQSETSMKFYRQMGIRR